MIAKVRMTIKRFELAVLSFYTYLYIFVCTRHLKCFFYRLFDFLKVVFSIYRSISSYRMSPFAGFNYIPMHFILEQDLQCIEIIIYTCMS